MTPVPPGARGRIAPAFTCPVCDRIVHHASPASGHGWYHCAVRHRDHPDACPGHWLNLVIPAGTTTAAFALRHTPTVARALLAAVRPELVSASGTLVAAALVPRDATAPAHLQLLTRRRDEYHLRYAPLAIVLRGLHLLPAATDGSLQRAG